MKSNPLLIGAISGALGGLVVDINSFLAWSKANDHSKYNWKLALSRIVQGALAGSVGSSSVSLVS